MLLDTSGLLNLLLAREPQHELAAEYYYAAEQMVTHSYVLAEFVALAQARGLARAIALDFVGALESIPYVKVVYVDRELHHAALGLLRQRLDKEWSLCDAVSFVLMERLDIREALTTDHHFKQADFMKLLSV